MLFGVSLLHGREEREDDNYDVFGARPRGFERGVGRVTNTIVGERRDFFRQIFL